MKKLRNVGFKSKVRKLQFLETTLTTEKKALLDERKVVIRLKLVQLSSSNKGGMVFKDFAIVIFISVMITEGNKV